MATTKSTTANKSTPARKAPARKPAASKAEVKLPEADIEISIEAPRPITVNLGGVHYTVRPIKGALGLALGQRMQGVKGDAAKLQDAIDHIVGVIFGPSEKPGIMERLSNPEDSLDFTHVMSLMNALVEKSTGSPTT